MVESLVSVTRVSRKRAHIESTDNSAPTNQIKLHKKENSAQHQSIQVHDIARRKSISLHSLASPDPQLLADRLAQRNADFGRDLTPLELEETRIPVHCIIDTSGWQEGRTAENLADFMRQFSVTDGPAIPLREAPNVRGSPHTFIVSMSGLRAANLTRALRVFQTQHAVVAKLFAKHIKLKDAIESVKNTRMSIGVGTPSRIIDLLDSGSLNVNHLQRIVVDLSHLDEKKRTILDMKETQRPLMELLNRHDVKSRYRSDVGSIELLFF